MTTLVAAALLFSGYAFLDMQDTGISLLQMFGMALFLLLLSRALSVPSFVAFCVIADKLSKSPWSTALVKSILALFNLLYIWGFFWLTGFGTFSENRESPYAIPTLYSVILLVSIAVFKLRETPPAPREL